MNVIVATYLGIGVVAWALACLVGLAYLSGRGLAFVLGENWSKASTEARGFFVGNAIVGVSVAAMLLFILGLVGYEIATGFGWIGGPQ